jgi:hypothetical protein
MVRPATFAARWVVLHAVAAATLIRSLTWVRLSSPRRPAEAMVNVIASHGNGGVRLSELRRGRCSPDTPGLPALW